MIEIQCPNCERVLKVPDKYVGTEGACNYCGGRVQVQARAQAAATVAPPAVAPVDSALQPQLAEAREEIVRLGEALDAERAARECAETEREAALARVSELEASAVQAEEREHGLAPRAELEKALHELAESREFGEWLGRELETHRARADQAQARLRDVRARLEGLAGELSDLPGAEPAAVAAAAAVAEAEPAQEDAAAILIGGSGGRKKTRWAWVVGATIALLAVAAGIGAWGLGLVR